MTNISARKIDWQAADGDPGSCGAARKQIAFMPTMLDDFNLKITEPGSDDLRDMLAAGDFWLTPFQLPQWTQAWQEGLGASHQYQPVIVLFRQGEQTVAILPLALCRHWGSRCLTWHAHPQSDYGAPIVRKSHLERFARVDGVRLFREIADQLGGIDLVYLYKQPQKLGSFANPLILPGSSRHHAGAHAINFNGAGDWDSFLAARRSASTRQTLRKKQRGLEKLGKVTFRVASDAADARSIITECLAAKSRQLAKLGHWDPFATQDVRSFLTDYFSAGLGTTNWAVALDLDGLPIATSFGFMSKDEWLLYQMAMSGERGGQYSPGTQLLMGLMRRCVAAGVARLDLSLGDESYKLEWCDEHMTLMTSTLPLSMRGAITNRGVKLQASLQLRLSENPQLYHAGKKLKRALFNRKSA